MNALTELNALLSDIDFDESPALRLVGSDEVNRSTRIDYDLDMDNFEVLQDLVNQY